MSETALRPRRATEIVDAAFALYRRNLGQYLLVTGIAYSPILIVTAVVGTENPSVGGNLVAFLVSILGNALMTAAVVSLGSQAYLGGEPDSTAAIRHAARKILPIIGATFMLGAAYLVGMLLLLVGFFYFLARYFAVMPVIVLEDASPSKAFDRSSTLSQNLKKHILATLLLVYGLFFLAQWGLLLILPSQAFLLTAILTIVAYPIIGLATMLLYYDTRIRREGFDLEVMTQKIGIPNQPVVERTPA